MTEQKDIKIILASASPRRLDLLRQAGVEPEVLAVDVAELTAGLAPAELVRRNAELKARAAAKLRTFGPQEYILAADTVVALGQEIFGKPADEAEACQMLSRLSGREHSVFSGVAVWHDGGLQSGVTESRVCFRVIEPQEIAEYAASGEPLDKAGAYAVQGGAAKFVSSIVGDFDNIVGLPIRLAAKMLPAEVFAAALTEKK